MSLRARIDTYGQKGNNMLMKELRQLHDRKAMLPKRKETAYSGGQTEST